MSTKPEAPEPKFITLRRDALPELAATVASIVDKEEFPYELASLDRTVAAIIAAGVEVPCEDVATIRDASKALLYIADHSCGVEKHPTDAACNHSLREYARAIGSDLSCAAAPVPDPARTEYLGRFNPRSCVGCGYSWERCCGRLENVGDRCCSACAHPGTSKPAASNEPANLGLDNLPVLRRVTHADKQRVAELLANVAPDSTPLRTELRTDDELPCVATDTTEHDHETVPTLGEVIPPAPAPHPEDACERCGRPNVWSWHAPSPLWNAVMRDPATGIDRFNIVCPPCFAALVEEAGIGKPQIDEARRLVWCFRPHDLDVTTLWRDADGRTWDGEECLWVEPPAPVTEKCAEREARYALHFHCRDTCESVFAFCRTEEAANDLDRGLDERHAGCRDTYSAVLPVEDFDGEIELAKWKDAYFRVEMERAALAREIAEMTVVPPVAQEATEPPRCGALIPDVGGALTPAECPNVRPCADHPTEARPEGGGEEPKADAQIFYAADILGNALKSDHRRSSSGTYMKLTYAEALEIEKALAVAGRVAPPLDAQALAEELVTVTPNITGERAELWLAGSYRVTASADVEDVLSAARHIREDVAAFVRAFIERAAGRRG